MQFKNFHWVLPIFFFAEANKAIPIFFSVSRRSFFFVWCRRPGYRNRSFLRICASCCVIECVGNIDCSFDWFLTLRSSTVAGPFDCCFSKEIKVNRTELFKCARERWVIKLCVCKWFSCAVGPVAWKVLGWIWYNTLKTKDRACLTTFLNNGKRAKNKTHGGVFLIVVKYCLECLIYPRRSIWSIWTIPSHLESRLES